MAKTMLICKACGKEYEACRTPNPGIFRWRDVACSEECARKYIYEVQLARGEITEEPAVTPVQEESVESNPGVHGFSQWAADESENIDDVSEPDVVEEPRSWRTGRNRKK